MARVAAAIPAIRSSVSRRRSISASDSPASRPASRSRALASRISGARASSASAIARSAASLSAVGSVASRREVALAARQMSVTEEAATSMAEGYRRSALRQHEVVAVHGLLGRARQDLADLGGLQALDAAQLGGRQRDDALAQQPPVVGGLDLDRVAAHELTADVDDPDRQQR